MIIDEDNNIIKIETKFTKHAREINEANKLRELRDQEENSIILEVVRMGDFIRPYMNVLKLQLLQINKNKIYKFWTFSNDAQFKKNTKLDYFGMQKYVKTNKIKYQNQKIASFTIDLKDDSKRFSWHDRNTWINVKIIIFHMDNECNMSTIPAWGVNLIWTSNDFKTTKFSFALIQNIMQIIINNKYIFNNFTEVKITKALEILHTNNYDLSNLLFPLNV